MSHTAHSHKHCQKVHVHVRAVLCGIELASLGISVTPTTGSQLCSISLCSLLCVGTSIMIGCITCIFFLGSSFKAVPSEVTTAYLCTANTRSELTSIRFFRRFSHHFVQQPLLLPFLHSIFCTSACAFFFFGGGAARDLLLLLQCPAFSCPLALSASSSTSGASTSA